MKTTTRAQKKDWLTEFREQVARMRGAGILEAFKADSLTLALLTREQEQLSLCWNSGRKRP